MKASIALLVSITALPVFAGEMAGAHASPHTTYVAIGGGYYGSNDQANYTNYTLGSLTAQQSFNDTNTSGYGQLGLGSSAQLGGFEFDHQLSIGKLGDAITFTTPDSNWRFSQNVDFGYDFMPKINMHPKISAFGILGVHYARFTYKKSSSAPTATIFNDYKDQIGFNLGAGINYQFNDNVVIGIKYQHWQYGSTQVNGINSASTSIDIEQFVPAFNLIGAELHYYIG